MEREPPLANVQDAIGQRDGFSPHAAYGLAARHRRGRVDPDLPSVRYVDRMQRAERSADDLSVGFRLIALPRERCVHADSDLAFLAEEVVTGRAERSLRLGCSSLERQVDMFDDAFHSPGARPVRHRLHSYTRL